MKIRAAVFGESPKPTLRDLELSGPGPGEVLVKVVACGVCHTDLKSAEPGSRVPRPVVLGHEGSGIVEAIGSGVTEFRPGDHVVMSFDSCAYCPTCLMGQPAYCHNQNHFACTRSDGSFYLYSGKQPIHGTFFAQSSFATYAIGSERSVVKVPKDVALEMLGPLGCGIQTGVGAVFNDLALQPGQALAIFGAGAVGLSAIMAAKMAGASRIVALDRNAQRLQLAIDLGATDALLADDRPLSDQVRRLIPQGIDLTFDTTGISSVMNQAIAVLAPLGTCCFAAPPSDTSTLTINPLHLLKGRRICSTVEGGSNPKIFIPQLIEFHRDGRLPFDRLVTFYPFEEIEKAFHDSHAGTAIKPILRMTA